MDKYTAQAIATTASAALCALVAWKTEGASGVGWFIVSLLFIW